MKIYKRTNVFEEALNRIRFLYDEFDDVWVSHSGGKDSTIVYELTKIVAKEKKRLPVKVLFLDQEAEYQATIDLIKEVMYDKDVEPYWLQIPIKLFNATSTKEDWLYCWNPDDEDKWMRPKDDIAYHENQWGTERFADFFQRFMAKETPEGKTSCMITGVRAEESPARLLGMTQNPTYKWITWGKKNLFNERTFNFHAIYDWSYSDVWKAIHDNNWSYNRIYDAQYQYGVSIANMRVSNLHHETAVHHLFFLQEVEPDTYERLTQRISGISTANQVGKEDYYIRKLPYMFKDWVEYRDYLLEHLITEEDKRKKFLHLFKRIENLYGVAVSQEKMAKTQIQSILANDYHGTKIMNEVKGKWRLALKDYKRGLERNG